MLYVFQKRQFRAAYYFIHSGIRALKAKLFLTLKLRSKYYMYCNGRAEQTLMRSWKQKQTLL